MTKLNQPYEARRSAEAPTESVSDEAYSLHAITEALRANPAAFSAWSEFHDADPDLLALFSEHYIDHFASLEALGHHLVGNEPERLSVLGPLAPYASIDYKALAEDQLDNGDCIALPEPEGGFYLFRGPDGHNPDLDAS